MLDEYALFVAIHKTVIPRFSFYLGILLPETHRVLEWKRKEIHLYSSKVKNIVEVSIKTASLEWPTGGRPTNG